MQSHELAADNSRFKNNAKMVDEPAGNPVFQPEKYIIVPRPKSKCEEDEIRIASEGSVPWYVTQARQQLSNPNQQKVTLKATGTAIAGAIVIAEIIKRRIPNIYQENRIAYTTITDTFKPLEEGLEEFARERRVAVMEITLAKDISCVDTKSVGYQDPIDQRLVRSVGSEQGDYFGARNNRVDQRRARGRSGNGFRRGRSRNGFRRRSNRALEVSQNRNRTEDGATANDEANIDSKEESNAEGYPADFSGQEMSRQRLMVTQFRRGGPPARRGRTQLRREG